MFVGGVVGVFWCWLGLFDEEELELAKRMAVFGLGVETR